MKVIKSKKNTKHLSIEKIKKGLNEHLMLTEKALAEDILLRETAEKLKIKIIIKFINLKQFCLLSVRDITILSQDALTERN